MMFLSLLIYFYIFKIEFILCMHILFLMYLLFKLIFNKLVLI